MAGIKRTKSDNYWMVDGNNWQTLPTDNNSVGLISAKYFSDAKWCGQQSGVVYFISNSFDEKVTNCLSICTTVCPDWLLVPPFSNYPITILTVCIWGAQRFAFTKKSTLATDLTVAACTNITRCAWAGGTCVMFPDFCENHQFHFLSRRISDSRFTRIHDFKE